MATLIVRRVDERLVAALKERARRHGRSTEAEHRAILKAALLEQAPSTGELLAYFRRGAELGLGEVEIGQDGGGPVEPAFDRSELTREDIAKALAPLGSDELREWGID